MNTLITVILYGKRPIESLTLNKLLDINYDEYELMLVNNGPDLIDFNDSFLELLSSKKIKVSLFNFIENKPLSLIYNQVLNDNELFDRFIFFDDDSELDDDFFGTINSAYVNGVDLQLPLILDSDIAYYPVVDGVVFQGDVSTGFLTKYNELFSIGSGLIIYSNLIKKFKKINMSLFDENFALYGVDYSLFRRISILRKKYKEDIKISICSKINHSLSRTDSRFSSSRHRERLIDIVLTERHYSKVAVKSIIKLISLSLIELLKFRFSNIYLIVSTYLRGHHPRCR